MPIHLQNEKLTLNEKKDKEKKYAEKEGTPENKILMQLFFEFSSIQRNALKLLNYANTQLSCISYFFLFWMSQADKMIHIVLNHVLKYFREANVYFVGSMFYFYWILVFFQISLMESS